MGILVDQPFKAGPSFVEGHQLKWCLRREFPALPIDPISTQPPSAPWFLARTSLQNWSKLPMIGVQPGISWISWINQNWLVVWNIFYDFPYIYIYIYIYWECHHPNWLTPSFFQRGRAQPPTREVSRWVVTNAHVVHRAVSVLVRPTTGNPVKYNARPLGVWWIWGCGLMRSLWISPWFSRGFMGFQVSNIWECHWYKVDNH